MSIWLRVGGYPATEIAAHTAPTWETWADGGTGSISWQFDLSPGSQHHALRVGAPVEVMCGPVPVASGLMTDPDRTTWECVAYGHAADARNYLALDGTGAPTRDVATAIATAQAAGWAASNPSAITGTVAGDPDGNPITLGQLLDEYAVQLGQRWGVDGKGRLFLAADATVPRWMASPESAAFGSTNEGRANTLKGRYLDSTSGLYVTATAGAGAPQAAVDLSERGAMSSADATAILDGMLALDTSQRAWTNGVTLTADQLQTTGGTPAMLAGVRAGQAVSTFGIAYGWAAFRLLTVIGKTKYTAGERTIYVEPVNTAPRSLSDVIAAS